MIRTDGTPTIAFAGASTKDRNSRRRWLARKAEARRAQLARIRARRKEAAAR